MTFERAMYLMPSCLVGACDNPKTIADLISSAQHEIDSYEEGQDGALNFDEIRRVRKFKSMLVRSETMLARTSQEKR